MLGFKLAYRNLFRNTRRTVLTCILITSSLIVIILTDGMVIGMTEIMIGGITKTFAGEAQVHHRGFQENNDVDLYIANPQPMLDRIAADEGVAAYAERVIAGGMIASSYNVTGGAIFGVEPTREPHVSKIELAMIEGEFLSGKPRELIMGKPMAELLEVGLGDRIVLTTSMVGTGEIAQELFRVSGLFELGQTEIDENLVFINLPASQTLLGMGSGVHEIVLQFHDAEDGKSRTYPLIVALNDDDTIAQVWLDFNPSIGAMMEMLNLPTLMIGAILFLLASLGVINSMFMSIYERIYEFGVIRAIGTAPSEVMSLVLLEAFFIAVISCVVGLVAAYFLSSYFAVNGIPMGKMEVSGVVLDGNMYTRLTLAQFTQFPVYVVILTLVAAVYPAVFAARIVPAEALHKSL